MKAKLYFIKTKKCYGSSDQIDAKTVSHIGYSFVKYT